MASIPFSDRSNQTAFSEKEQAFGQESDSQNWRTRAKMYQNKLKCQQKQLNSNVQSQINKSFEKRLHLKSQLENQLMEQCTFSPQTADNYASRNENALKGEDTIQEVNLKGFCEDTASSRSFKTSQTSSPSLYHQKRIYEHLETTYLQQELEQIVQQTQEDQLEQSSESIQFILQKSKEIAARIENQKKFQVFDRLYNNPKSNRCKENQQQNCAVVNKKGDFGSFLERQQQFQSDKETNRAKVQEQYSKIQKCSFEPKVNEVSRAIYNYAENKENVYKRLYDHQPQPAKEFLHSKVPSISQASRLIAEHRDTFAELTAPVNTQLRQGQVEYQLSKVKECTFTPQINQVSKHLNGSVSTSSIFSYDIKKQQTVRDEWVQSQISSKIQEQLEQCTFVPTINSKTNYNKDPNVQVKGLERYFEVRDLHKRQEQEKKKREMEVFGVQQKRKSVVTIPKAPKLRTQSRSRAVDADKFKDLECTFKPKTLYTTTKELLNS